MRDSIYKVVTASEWEEASKSGEFAGSEIDLRDGYIHFSTSNQLEETLSRHFCGMKDLLLLQVDVAMVKDELRWEISRNEEKFPHLYRPLKVEQVRSVHELPLSGDGIHEIPQTIFSK